ASTAMNYKSILLAFLAIAISATTVLSQETITYISDPTGLPREQQVDMKHLRLEVKFDVKEGKVLGKVTENFVVLRENVDSMFLDGIEMKFNSVEFDGKAVDYKEKDNGIEIYFSKPL